MEDPIPSWPLIVGHRGASALAPENTIAAFRRAVADRAEGLEFDVRLARDGVPVVIHDDSLARTGAVNALVSDLTSDELAKIDVGGWFHRKEGSEKASDHAQERVPTLAETLQSLSGFNGPIFVELKCSELDSDRLSDAVCDVLRGSEMLPQVIVKSFKLAVLPRVKMRLPSVRTAALFAPKIMTILRKEKHMVSIADEFGADELSIHCSLATRKLMKKAEARGLPVNIWTADNPRWVKRGIRLGLRSIITNDPARLLARRAELMG